MYIPSNAYSGWRDDVTDRTLEIRLYHGQSETVVPLENIMQNSIKITDNVCMNGKFHTGGVIAKQLDMRFIRYAEAMLYGAEIEVKVVYTLANQSSVVYPMGRFVVDVESIEKGRNGDVGFKAYDHLTDLDKVVTKQDQNDLLTIINALTPDPTTAEFPIWKYIDFAAQKCGLTIDQSAFQALNCFGWTLRTNPSPVTPSPPMSLFQAVKGGLTFRDVVSSAASLAGCAIRLDRTGKISPVSFITANRDPDYTFDANNVISRTVNDHYGTIFEATYSGWQSYEVGTGTPDERVILSQPSNVFLYDSEDDYNLPTYPEWIIGQSVDTTLTGLADDFQMRGAELVIFGDEGIDAGDYVVSEQDWLETTEIGLFVMEYIWAPHMNCVVKSFGVPSSSVNTGGIGRDYGQVTRLSRTVSELIKLDQTAQEVSISTTYSTDEHSVGLWLDGKALYEKTYVFSALGDDTTREVSQDLGIHVGDIYLDEIVESKGQYIDTSVSAPLPFLPLLSDGSDVDPDKAIRFYIDLSTEKLKVVNGATDRSGCKAYITLRYTTTKVVNLYTEDTTPAHTENNCAVVQAPWNTGLNSNNTMVAEWVPVTVGKQYMIMGAAGRAGGISIGWTTARDTTGASSGHWGTQGGDFTGQTATFTADQPYVVLSRIRTEPWSNYGLWEI